MPLAAINIAKYYAAINNIAEPAAAAATLLLLYHHYAAKAPASMLPPPCRRILLIADAITPRRLRCLRCYSLADYAASVVYAIKPLPCHC